MVYLILSFNLVFVLLVVTYWLLFRDGHAFRQNRLLLLLLPLLSLLIPQIPRPMEGMQNTVTEQIRERIPFTAHPFGQELRTLSPLKSERPMESFSEGDWPVGMFAMTWAQALFCLYLAGVVVFLGRHVRQWFTLVRVLARGQQKKQNGYTLVQSRLADQPFSFFNWVVIPMKTYRFADYQQIIDHELIHVRQKHTWDILQGEWLQILCWFNPGVKLYRELTRNNLEYLVDDTLLSRGVDQRTYQYSLLSVSLGNRPIVMGTNYNNSFIKKRIHMMNTLKKKDLPFWKIGLVAIQFFGIIQLFGQDLPPVTKGMQIILIGEKATYSELATLQDAVSSQMEKARFGATEVVYNEDGTLASLEAKITLPKASGGTRYNQNETPGLAFLPLFLSVRSDGIISCGTLDDKKLEQIIALYDDVQLFVAGLDPAKENLIAMLPDIRQKYQDRLAYMEKRKKTSGTPFSSSITFSPDHASEDDGSYVDLLEEYIQNDLDKGDFTLEYYLDGLKRDIELNQLDFSSIASVEIRTKGLKKAVDGVEKITGVVQIWITRKRPRPN